MFLQFLVDHSGFQQARTHLRNPSAHQREPTPPSAGLSHENQKPKLSAQQVASSRLFCQMGRQGECVAVVPPEPQLHIHPRLKSLLTWQKSRGSHPMALWLPQAAVTSSCPLVYSFIVQNDPGSAVALVDFPIGTHMRIWTICHGAILSPWKATGVLQLSYVLQHRPFCPDAGRSPTDFQVHVLLVFWYGYYLSKRTWQTA